MMKPSEYSGLTPPEYTLLSQVPARFYLLVMDRFRLKEDTQFTG
jgi:hypothetical protein